MSEQTTDKNEIKKRIRSALDVLENYVDDDGKINATKLTQEITRSGQALESCKQDLGRSVERERELIGELDKTKQQLAESLKKIADLRGGKMEKFPDITAQARIEQLEARLCEMADYDMLQEELATLQRQLSASRAREEKFRALYVRLTNADQCNDGDTGEIFYCADQKLMAEFDALFAQQSQPAEGGGV